MAKKKAARKKAAQKKVTSLVKKGVRLGKNAKTSNTHDNAILKHGTTAEKLAIRKKQRMAATKAAKGKKKK
jgi:hypothetical protein